VAAPHTRRTIRAVRRLLLVVNVVAQAVTRYARDVITGALSSEFRVEAVETKGPGHAAELAAGAAERGLDLVVVLGGDGTINEVANGLAGTDVPMAVLPGGGANVFARSLGLPRDAVEAAGVLLERLHEAPRRVPLGRANDRWFLVNAGVGIDAAIVRRVEGRQFAKRMAGELFFAWSALRVLFTQYDRRTPHLRVTLGDEVVEDAFSVFAQNVDPYTFVGDRPIRLCAEASLDGGLDAVALRSMRTTLVAGLLLRALRSGAPARRGAVYGHDLASVLVEADVPMPLQVDGEFVGEVERVSILSVPGALGLYG
jgi:diacylglycerol kinase family enzyme